MPISLENSRTTHVTKPQTILSNIEAHGIAVDWVSHKLYVTNSTGIIVSTFDGQKYYHLLSGELHQPREIAVAPSQGLLFWATWEPSPKIESAQMDGYRRKVLVKDRLLWPTGLALDHPAERLYWADAKAMTIETVKFDGSDRQIVKHFTDSKYKLNYLYI